MKRWTTKEVEYLVAHQKRKTVEQIAFELDRTYTSVVKKMRSMGLIMLYRHSIFKGCDNDCFNCKYDDCYKE